MCQRGRGKKDKQRGTSEERKIKMEARKERKVEERDRESGLPKTKKKKKR